jgi:hypothetical protein
LGPLAGITTLVSAIELVAAPGDIYDGEALVNGWVNAGGATNFELNDGFVSMISAANNGWLQHDNDESVWEKGVADGGSWTAEISVRLAADEDNGLVIWGANGVERNILQVNTGNTQTLTGTVLDENDNTDAFHTFRLAFEAEDGLYYVWRDGVLLTPDGIAKQAGTGANRFIVGDCCSNIPMSMVDLEYIRYDTTGAFADVLEIDHTHRDVRAAVAHDEPVRTGAGLLGDPVRREQHAVAPHVVQPVLRLEGQPEGMERVRVVVLIQHRAGQRLCVPGVDLQDVALHPVGAPDDKAIVLVGGQADGNFRRPRAAVGHALLPHRLVVVVLQPSVVGRRDHRHKPVVQLEVRRATGVDPAVHEGFTVVNIARGCNQLDCGNQRGDSCQWAQDHSFGLGGLRVGCSPGRYLRR